MRVQPPGAGAMREGLCCASCGSGIVQARFAPAAATVYREWRETRAAAPRGARIDISLTQAVGYSRHEPRDMVPSAR